MLNQMRKVNKLIEVLGENRVRHTAPIQEVLVCPCGYKTGHTPPPLSSFTVYDQKGKWGSGNDSHVWFYLQVDRPEEMRGEEMHLRVDTDKTGWDAGNPQFIAYVDGTMRQGLDTNHTDLLLEGKDRFAIYLYAYTGQSIPEAELRVSLYTVDPDVEKLYYDLLVPKQVLDFLDTNSHTYATTLTHLSHAVDLLDLRRVPSEEFYASVRVADAYLQHSFYGAYCRPQEVSTVCIGHTHIDCAWLWTLAQTREKVQRSFATVIELMKRYPEYKFMSSQALLYKYAKEESPALYEEIRKMVRAGRWEVEGAMWVEADCNLSSGESLVRQVLYGKRFFRDEFGVNSHILWLPDVFGYSAALPQILRKSGVDWFVTSKISWNEENMMPYDTFRWRGIDGTEINSYFLTPQMQYRDRKPERYTTYVGTTHAAMIAGTYNRYQQKNLSDEAILTYGYGDGGGGPTQEHIELLRRTAQGIPGCPNGKSDFAGNMLARLGRRIEGNPRLPVWQGELYLELHRGTYTGIAKNKKNNRESEFLYENTELLCTLSDVLGGDPFPKEALHVGWEDILTHQFHDIIPGSSIKEVYDESDRAYAQIRAIAEREREKAISYLLGKIKADGKFVVFNPHSFVGNGVVTYEGRAYYVENVPAKGYCTVELTERPSRVRVKDRCVETPFFLVEFDESYTITRLYDKKNQREVLRSGCKGNQLMIHEDYPYNWDGWEMSAYHTDKTYLVNALSSVEVVEEGARTGIRLVRPYMQSRIEQTVWFYSDMPKIDFETRADWHQHHQFLKVAFPVDVNADHATYEIQFGTIERPTHRNTSWDRAKFEVCGHKYADLSEGNYGVSLLNDCKYGHDIHDGVMKLTLIKCATYPNPEADQGEHRFTYSLYPHAGNLRDSDTVKLAYDLNQPMQVYAGRAGDGSLPERFSAVSCDADNIILETVKIAEDGNDVILRMYETKNERTAFHLHLGIPAEEVWLCDLMENPVERVEGKNGEIALVAKPFEILTLRLTRGE